MAVPFQIATQVPLEHFASCQNRRVTQLNDSKIARKLVWITYFDASIIQVSIHKMNQAAVKTDIFAYDKSFCVNKPKTTSISKAATFNKIQFSPLVCIFSLLILCLKLELLSI